MRPVVVVSGVARRRTGEANQEEAHARAARAVDRAEDERAAAETHASEVARRVRLERHREDGGGREVRLSRQQGSATRRLSMREIKATCHDEHWRMRGLRSQRARSRKIIPTNTVPVENPKNKNTRPPFWRARTECGRLHNNLA